MSKKYTKDDYFAAASAQDLWAFDGIYGDLDLDDICDLCDGDGTLYNDLYKEAEKIMYSNISDNSLDNACCNVAYLAAQIGCEKAGLSQRPLPKGRGLKENKANVD